MMSKVGLADICVSKNLEVHVVSWHRSLSLSSGVTTKPGARGHQKTEELDDHDLYSYVPLQKQTPAFAAKLCTSSKQPGQRNKLVNRLV